jgi:predicted lipid carrier protein YhbT
MKRPTKSNESGMTDLAEKFFEELGRRGHEPLLAKVSGRVRFDLVDGAHTDPWLVTIDKGDLTVSHEPGDGDCAIRGGKALFDELAAGRANAMSSVLRGALECTGDLDLLLAIQRIFPAPPRALQESPGGARSPR